MDKKVAIVTGGSEGIGKGIATALAKKDFSVYLIARTEENLQKAKDEIIKQTGNEKVEYRKGDITKIEQIRNIIDEVYDLEKRLDVFVNNAGTWKYQSIETPFDEIWNLVQFLAKPAFETTHYLIEKFKDNVNNNLKILTIASQASLKIMPGNLGYNPGKILLASSLFSLQGEMERKGINNIKLYRLYPNTVATEKYIPDLKAGKLKLDNPTTLESVVEAAIDILEDKTPTKDVRVGYYPGRGIVRSYLSSAISDYPNFKIIREEVIDPNFNPSEYFK